MSILQFWECVTSLSCCDFRGVSVNGEPQCQLKLEHVYSSINKATWQKQTVFGTVEIIGGSYTVVLRWGVVMIMAFSQLQSQCFQSLQLVQSSHAFLDKRHHPERDGGGGDICKFCKTQMARKINTIDCLSINLAHT